MQATSTKITTKQRKVLKVLLEGGVIYKWPNKRTRAYRLLDKDRNPLENVHGRCFNSMMNKGLITKNIDGLFTATPKQ